MSEFVDLVNGLSFSRIMADTECEVDQAEYASFKAKDARDFRIRGSVQYAETLQGLLFLLRYGKTPDGVAPEDLLLFRPIVENLIGKGELKPEALELFENCQAGHGRAGGDALEHGRRANSEKGRRTGRTGEEAASSGSEG